MPHPDNLRRFSVSLVLAVAVAASAAGCSAPQSASPQPGSLTPSTNAAAAPSPIKHVVIVVQENRSFVNIFAGFPGADAPMSGIMHDGTKVALQPIGFYTLDLCHEWANGIQDWDGGKMDAFDLNCVDGGPPGGKLGYSYLRRSAVAPYWAMAKQYTLADRMFPTMFGPSFTAHLDLIAGTTNLSPASAVVDSPSNAPWGCDAQAGTTNPLLTPRRTEIAGPFPCYSGFRTMADTLDDAGISWRYYAPPLYNGGGGALWTAFDAIKSVRRGPDWKRNMVSPSPQVLADIAKGNLAGVTWVMPDWAYSDHADGGDMGPSWVAAVVNAVGHSPQWKSTAIVVLWDDWGGWYDDAPPPQLDFRGLGIRVGCIIVSPYARRHYVSHTQYEFGSVLRFVEETFGLPALGSAQNGYTDARANSLIDSFDFTQSPTPFQTIPARYPPSTFGNLRPSARLPDDD